MTGSVLRDNRLAGAHGSRSAARESVGIKLVGYTYPSWQHLRHRVQGPRRDRVFFSTFPQE
jgi:hypothetical protein